MILMRNTADVRAFWLAVRDTLQGTAAMAQVCAAGSCEAHQSALASVLLTTPVASQYSGTHIGALRSAYCDEPLSCSR